MLSICFVATFANRALVFHCYGNKLIFSLNTLLWILLTLIPDLLVLLILYILLFYIGWKYPPFGQWSMVLGLSFAAFILLVSSCNIMMLTITGKFVITLL